MQMQMQSAGADAGADDSSTGELNDELSSAGASPPTEYNDETLPLGDVVDAIVDGIPHVNEDTGGDGIDNENETSDSEVKDTDGAEEQPAHEQIGHGDAQGTTPEPDNDSIANEDLFNILGGVLPGTENDNAAPERPTPTPPADKDEDITYVPGDLQQLKKGLLLSRGLDVAIIAQSGKTVQFADGSHSALPFHGSPDFGATFASPNDDTYVYVSNSEIVKSAGGVGAITFDKDGRVIGYGMPLQGTSMNCVSVYSSVVVIARLCIFRATCSYALLVCCASFMFILMKPGRRKNSMVDLDQLRGEKW